jgi:hypothetical protein
MICPGWAPQWTDRHTHGLRIGRLPHVVYDAGGSGCVEHGSTPGR